MKATLSELGNPFEEDSTDLYALDTKEVADSSVKKPWTSLFALAKSNMKSL